MASLITGLINLGSRLLCGWTIAWDELAEWTANRGSLIFEAVGRVLKAVPGAQVRPNRGGATMRLRGIGHFRTTSDRQGWEWMRIVRDLALVGAPSKRGAYRGEIQNRAISGVSDTWLRWLPGTEPPDDPLDLPLRWAG